MAIRVALIGGGSGGHVYPLVAVGQELQKQAVAQGVDLKLWMLGDGEFLKKAAEESGIMYKNIQGAKWRRYFSVQNFLDLFKIPLGILQSLFYLWHFMPDIVFAKGGYASVIPAFIAWFFAIPVVIHESDSVPGKANIILGKLSKKVFTSFEKSKSYFPENRTELTGNPIRLSVLEPVSKDEALQLFQLSKDKPVILVLGGSQGAQIINQAIVSSIVELAGEFQIIHQFGDKNKEVIESEVKKIMEEGGNSYAQSVRMYYRPYPFLNSDQMRYAYSAADIIVTRAGSGSLFEAAALGKPSIVIPISSSASDHQRENALEFSKYGGIMIEEPNLTPHILIDQIKEAYKKREELSSTIRQFAKPDAAEKIAQSLLVLISGG